MRHPVSFSINFHIPWRKKDWLPKFGYDKPVIAEYSKQFMTQGCTWFKWLAIRTSIVWSNK